MTAKLWAALLAAVANVIVFFIALAEFQTA